MSFVLLLHDEPTHTARCGAERATGGEFVGAVLVLLLAEVLAAYWPVRQASRLDPATLLRHGE